MIQPAEDLLEALVDRVDRVMSFAEAVPWGKRWAARIPNVIGYEIEVDATAALAELRKRVVEDLEGVCRRLKREQSRRFVLAELAQLWPEALQ